MEKLTRQQVYDSVVTHLIEQWAKAFDSGLERYRATSGRTCAIGCLITAGYSPVIEGVAIEGLRVRPLDAESKALANALRLSGVDVDDPVTVSMLSELQGVHDGWSVAYWPEQLRRVGRTFDLSPSAVDVALAKREAMYSGSIHDVESD